ncbi:MAG: hypothetical protein J5958_05850, partial [Clostridia bacterium]|nr:hypothetical protein [Clostridia bacterium]
ATAATVATGATAAAGAIAATVATAVIVVAVFVSTLAINLTLLLTGMHSLVFRVAMTGVQDEDFETPIYASISDGGDFYQEQQVYRDTILLTFLDLTPGTEYLVTVQNENQIFFQKTYITADEDAERGFLSAWAEDNEIFLSVEGVVLDADERFTVTAKDDRGNVVFARDGVASFAEYSFKLDKPRNLFFTLLVGGQIAAVTEIRMESEPEPEWEYDPGSAEWNWDDGYTSATVSFAEIHGFDPLILSAEVEEVVVTPAGCETDGTTVYYARVLYEGEEYSDERTVTVPRHGHDYQPEFVWDLNQDGWYDGATLIFVCSYDPDHTNGVEIEAEPEPTSDTEPTCTDSPTTTYTATVEYEGKTYTDERIVVWPEPALGHDFGDIYENEPDESAFSYSYNGNGEIIDATMTLYCERCKQNVTMHATTIEVMPSEVDDLCNEGGEAEYYLFWDGGENVRPENRLEYGRSVTVTVGPIGHDYYEPSYFWIEDQDDSEAFVGVRAIFTCKHNSDHQLPVDMEMKVDEIPADCWSDAYTVYTATLVYNEQTYTDQRRVDHPETALGHEFPEPDPENDVEGVTFRYETSEYGEIVSATMTRVCAVCGNEETVEADEVELVMPEILDLCEYDGSAEYRLYWADDEFEKYVTATIMPAGHDYDFEDVEFEWDEDFKEGYTANAILTCRRNPDHAKTIEATITEEDDRYIATAHYGEHTFTDERMKD